MKRIVYVLLGALALLMVNSPPSQAFHGGHGGEFGVGVWIGPGLWGPNYPYYSLYAAPPVVAQGQPETYIQETPESEEPSYWYYCPDPQGYYPYVKKCPKGWMRVVPSPSPAEPEE